MKTNIAATVIAALSLSAVSGTSASAQTFEVLRAGDSQMTCEALMAEVNSLNEAIRKQAEQAERGAQTRATAGRVGRGLLSGLAQGAQMFGMGGMGGGGDAITNMVASAAVSGVANELANSAANPAPSSAPAAAASRETPERQRVAHLTGMYGQRC